MTVALYEKEGYSHYCPYEKEEEFINPVCQVFGVNVGSLNNLCLWVEMPRDALRELLVRYDLHKSALNQMEELVASRAGLKNRLKNLTPSFYMFDNSREDALKLEIREVEWKIRALVLSGDCCPPAFSGDLKEYLLSEIKRLEKHNKEEERKRWRMDLEERQKSPAYIEAQRRIKEEAERLKFEEEVEAELDFIRKGGHLDWGL